MRRPVVLTLTASLLVALFAGLASANICEFTELDTITPGGSLTVTEIEGNLAYVAAGDSGIAIIDISDPSNLLLQGFTPTQGQEALGLAMNSFTGYLTVADGDAGVGFYTANGGAVSHNVTLDLDEKIISIGSLATQLFVGGDQGTIYAPAYDGTTASSQGSITLSDAVLAMVLKPPRIYAALGAGGVALVNASNVANMTLVSQLDLGGNVMSVARENNVLYCGVEGVGLVSLSLDGDSMTQVGSLSLPGTPHSMVVTGGRIYMASPDVGLMVADTSLGDNMLLLGELPLSNATGITKAGDTLYVGRGTSGYSTIDAEACAGGGQITVYYIPAAARAEGGAGTYWVTDVAITNLTDSSAVVNVAYLEKDSINTTPANISFAIDSGEQQLLADVFDSLFGLASGNGGLRITASAQDVKATSRTYNAAGLAGTYGQFIPAIEMNDALAPGVVGALLQLQENSSFRTNIGLLNRTSIETDVEIKFYRANGTQSGTRILTLRPYEMKQFNVRTYAGQFASGYALISIQTENGRIFCYGSVVDNESGDPIYIPTQSLATDLIFGH